MLEFCFHSIFFNDSLRYISRKDVYVMQEFLGLLNRQFMLTYEAGKCVWSPHHISNILLGLCNVSNIDCPKQINELLPLLLMGFRECLQQFQNLHVRPVNSSF